MNQSDHPLSDKNFLSNACLGAEQRTLGNLAFFVSFCAIGLFLATLVGILFHDVPAVLIPIALCLLTATLILVRSVAMRCFDTTRLLCVLFFALAGLHIVGGFLVADLTTTHTFIRSNEDVQILLFVIAWVSYRSYSLVPELEAP